jgi:NAD(P)-dependent dehydrogenase (short-subunit alcohol dehydrogenase family)
MMSSGPVRLAAAGALLTALAGCGAEAEPGDQEVAAQVSPGEHSPVRVGLTEWTIVVSRSHVPAGRLHLVVTNAGATIHDLVVKDSRGTWETPDLAPGERTRLTVRAGPHETLQLWCSMPGHRAQGMHTTLTTS